jgi:hypothetical protein
MAFYQGKTGYVGLGGIYSGPAVVNGALSAAATTLNLYGNGSNVVGTIVAGDTFTIAGEAGAPTHTVTGGPFYTFVTNAIVGLTFSTGIAAGGTVNNAAVTFTSTSVAQIKSWNLSTVLEELDATVMGVNWKNYVGGVASWTGSVNALLDLGDLRQLALFNKIIQGSPDGTTAALVLGLNSAPAGFIKQWYGAALLKNIQVQNQLGQIAPVTFQFTGNGVVAGQWV